MISDEAEHFFTEKRSVLFEQSSFEKSNKEDESGADLNLMLAGRMAEMLYGRILPKDPGDWGNRLVVKIPYIESTQKKGTRETREKNCILEG